MRILDLFSGIGGFSLAASWVWRDELEIVSFVEIDPFCRKILRKHWPTVPIIEDVRDVTKQESIDIICGGFPCPAFSMQGKRGGFEQDDLFFELIRVCRETKPRWIIIENVEGITKWLDQIRQEIENIGYEWQDAIFDARDFGVPQMRRRYFAVCLQRGMLSRSQYLWWVQGKEDKSIHDIQSDITNPEGWWTPTIKTKEEWRAIFANSRRSRDHHGIPDRMDRLRTLGNAICPQVAEEIFRTIKEIDKKFIIEVKS